MQDIHPAIKWFSNHFIKKQYYVAQTEREFIRQRQKEGIAAAKSRGVKFGREPMAMLREFEGVRRQWEQGKLSARGAAKELRVSHNTFLKWARYKNRGEKSALSLPNSIAIRKVLLYDKIVVKCLWEKRYTS